MKLERTHLFLAVVALLTVTIVWAYQPGPDIIRECPQCQISIRQQTTMSGNTIRAQYWTDGKMIALMLPDLPWLVKCPKCGTLFWLDEAKKIGAEGGLWGDDTTWPDAVSSSLPSEADFLSMLSAGPLPREKELYARTRAWWAANDAARTNEMATVSFSPAQEENLHALAGLQDEKNPDERITKAEIFRELGEFDECIELLEAPFENNRHTKVATFIKTHAEQKSQQVREIKE